MATISELIIILATTLLLAFLTFRRTARLKFAKKLPPGPGRMRLPLIGESFSFLKPHSPTTVGKFMEQNLSRFGNIFTSHLFGNLSVVSADPDFNRFVLKNEARFFGHGLPAAMQKVVGKYSISLMVGDEHKQMRSTVLEFLSAERLRTNFLRDAGQLASQLVSSWKEGEVISVASEATKFSLYIIVKKMLSMNPEDPDIDKLPIEYDSFIKGFVSFPLYFPGTAYWKAIQARKYIIKIFEKEMEARMGNKGRNAGNDEDDFLGWLTKNTDYPPEKIYDFLLGLLLAGHDTTSRAIPLLIYFLASCPKAVDQLREEHMQVLRSKRHGGETKLELDDFKRMEFTRCVINETLRLGNIATFIMRKAKIDVEFKDFVIPEGCTVIPHFAAVHLDPLLYEEPEHFNPWRWLVIS